MMTPGERRLRARIGAFALHATHDPNETTRAARAAWQARFEREVDPERVLPPAERARRAEAARRGYMLRLSLRAAQARRARRAGGAPAAGGVDR